ncbi:MAG: cob(I)yrinic acid a,c-diamide adenosyltransferase [Rhodospirillales bacterium]|nr:cob(I)yrinic acid a,c-diamide adenosyltransferase [Rhodospirillales bacterium]
MVKLTRIYTGGGDTGETSLASGQRLAKHAPRIEACGAVDEANSAIGMARIDAAEKTDAILDRVQNDLFDLGADLTMPEGGRRGGGALRITASQVDRMEKTIDAFNEDLSPLDSFVLPGGSKEAANLHFARTLVRRAERAVTRLREAEPVNPEVVRYLNRLSDLLFVLARHANDRGKNDVLWKPGANR